MVTAAGVGILTKVVAAAAAEVDFAVVSHSAGAAARALLRWRSN